MNRLAGIEARRHELALDAGSLGIGARQAELALLGIGIAGAALAPFLRIVRIDDIGGIGAIGRHIAVRGQQVPAAVALEDAAEVPAMAGIVGELLILVRIVDVLTVALIRISSLRDRVGLIV